jgi:hypothetical protein
VAEFKPRKDQRSAAHRWNRHVLGEDFIKVSAKQRIKSRQYVKVVSIWTSLSLTGSLRQGEGKAKK